MPWNGLEFVAFDFKVLRVEQCSYLAQLAQDLVVGLFSEVEDHFREHRSKVLSRKALLDTCGF